MAAKLEKITHTIGKLRKLKDNIEVVLVTPEMATSLLEANKHNRDIDMATVNKYVRSLQANEWTYSHQGIALDEDGNVIDGQHRLWAIVMSGIPAIMQITNGIPRSSQKNFDVGLMRRTCDTATLEEEWGRVSKFQISCIKRMLGGVQPIPGLTRVEELKYIRKYFEFIQFVLDCLPVSNRRIRNSATVAAMARATVKEGKEKIRNFAHVFATGETSNGTEIAAIRLRDTLLTNPLPPRIVYGKTENALRAYLNRTPLKIVKTADGEVFPLDTDKELMAMKTRVAQEQRLAKAVGLTGNARIVYELIKGQPGMSIDDISKSVLVSPRSAGHITVALEKAGRIHSKPSQRSGRGGQPKKLYYANV